LQQKINTTKIEQKVNQTVLDYFKEADDCQLVENVFPESENKYLI